MSTELDDKSKRPSPVPLASDVIPFLLIKASQIEKWPSVDKTARDKLAVLLRWLIHSTAIDCIQADFSGYENSERQGWDGFVEVNTATPWIPKGKSGWELSTEKKNVKTKANKDYRARIKSTTKTERADTAFVFATTRNWLGKRKWQKEKEAKGEWREVKALDASDLEQWLETSIPAQIWFAEQLGIDTSGLETLDNAWQRWVNIESKSLELTPVLFKHAVSKHLEAFQEFLGNKENLSPLSVVADSTDEALAFLCCLFNEIPDYKENRMQVLIANKPKPLETMHSILHPQAILIANTPIARDVFRFASNNHRIAVGPRGTVNSKPGLEVPINRTDFPDVLLEMGAKNYEEARRIAMEAGYSPTILRRQISNLPSIYEPDWAASENAIKLIPLALAGIWNKHCKADRKILSFLAHQEYHEIASTIAAMIRSEDSPVWSLGKYSGVVSKKDALLTIAENVSEINIEDFLECAKLLLSENTNWDSAPSCELKKSVCDSLVFLAVYGNELFLKRLGYDIKVEVDLLIRHLLTPMSPDKLVSHDAKLQIYAEAAPGTFLKIIDDELKKSIPAFTKSLTPSFLLALESLAWKHLNRVTSILAQLAQFTIENNSPYTPIDSLWRIYCSWKPHTSASLEERISFFEQLAKAFPDTARRLFIEDFSRKTVTEINYFRWRNDALNARKKITIGEMDKFRRAVLDVVADMDFSSEELGKLVQRLIEMKNEFQQRIWKLIDEWATNATDADKAYLREQIRKKGLNKRSAQAQNAYEKLLPRNLIFRHLWLFGEEHISRAPDEDLDHFEHYKQIVARREAAINEIFNKHGIEAVVALFTQCGSPFAVGESTGSCNLKAEAQLTFIQHCLATEGTHENQGLLGFLNKTEYEAIFRLLKKFEHRQQVRLLKCAPFDSKTWRLLDQLEPNVKQDYWQTVPASDNLEVSNLNIAADCFLSAKRPLEAFITVIMQPQKVTTHLLKDILFSLAKSSSQPEKNLGRYKYYLKNAFKALNDQSCITEHELAFLEFSFLNDDTEHIPYLERKIDKDPHWFAQVAVNLHLPQGVNEEILWEYYEVPIPFEVTVEKIYLMLEKIQHIPGANDDGTIDLKRLETWIKKIQELFKQNNKWPQVGDIIIGELLSKAVSVQDSEPTFAVCEVIEQCKSRDMAEHFKLGVLNGRGLRFSAADEGGDPERQLAGKFRKWAEKQKENKFYFVAGIFDKIAQDYEDEAIKIYDPEADIYNRTGHW